MRSLTRTLLPALFALGLGGAASAETPESTTSVEPGELTAITAARLDQLFENSFAHAADSSLRVFGGPSSMQCGHVSSAHEFETCVVTAQGSPRPSAPAAIAAN